MRLLPSLDDCKTCGAEDELYRGSRCWSCELAVLVDQLLTNPGTGVMAADLVPVAVALKSMKRSWCERSRPEPLRSLPRCGMHSHAEELATAEAEAARLSTLAYDKEVELELAQERLTRIEDSDDFGTEKMAAAEREVERLEQEVAEVSDELRSAADYLDTVERRAQSDDDEEDEDD